MRPIFCRLPLERSPTATRQVDVKTVGQILHPSLSRAPTPAGEPLDMVGTSKAGVQHQVTRQVPDPLVDPHTVSLSVHTQDVCRTGAWSLESQQDPNGGGLTGAVGTKEAKDLATADTEVQIDDRPMLAVDLGQPGRFNHWSGTGHRHPFSPRSSAWGLAWQCKHGRLTIRQILAIGRGGHGLENHSPTRAHRAIGGLSGHGRSRARSAHSQRDGVGWCGGQPQGSAVLPAAATRNAGRRLLADVLITWQGLPDATLSASQQQKASAAKTTVNAICAATGSEAGSRLGPRVQGDALNARTARAYQRLRQKTTLHLSRSPDSREPVV